MEEFKTQLSAHLNVVLRELWPAFTGEVKIETTKQIGHGDYACTAAMQLAKYAKLPPREIAKQISARLETSDWYAENIEKAEIAGPGYINFYISSSVKLNVVKQILEEGADYGHSRVRQKVKILLEYVSANPTGPLHVGHARQAALGDAIGNLLEAAGHPVHREFFYNDAGAQINNLMRSTRARAFGLSPSDAAWPKDAYNGEYIGEIAKDFVEKKSIQAADRCTNSNGNVEDTDNIREFAVAYLRREQDTDLKEYGTKFDQYYLESSLYSEGKVAKVVEKLKEKGATYEADGALWLKTTSHGDDKDRVMKKSDGAYTYFVPDIAYHVTKWERGYQRVINIQGTDHHGTIARVRAGLQALEMGIPKDYPSYVLHTMVKVLRGGEEVKISKRAGSYVTLSDLIRWTSRDAVRFFLLSRKSDTEYIFDIDLAVSKNNDNPVYYVQYAYARVRSVLRTWAGDVASLVHADLTPLQSDAALILIRKLMEYPEMLQTAARDLSPHDVCFYLRELAAAYHSFYNHERILVECERDQNARLALVAATAQVIKNGLNLLGVSAPETM